LISGIPFRPVPCYDGYYASATGKVYSKRGKHRGKILQPQLKNDGSETVGLFTDGRIRYHSVGRIILRTWIGEPEPGQVACHGIMGRRCHRLDNLSWGSTSKNNGADRRRDGTMPCPAKLTEEQVYSIRKDTRQTKVLCKVYGVGRHTIQRIRSGKTWKHLS
jgi:hypothetical protein